MNTAYSVRKNLISKTLRRASLGFLGSIVTPQSLVGILAEFWR
jgi:hypothetical protein